MEPEVKEKVAKKRPREIVMQRRLEIKALIEEVGLWNINKTSLAERYNLSRQMIDKDLHNIMRGMPAEDLKEISFNLVTAYKKALKECQKILATSQDHNEKIRAASTIAQVGRYFTEMLENYGLKEKIANKLQVEMQESNRDILKNILSGMKNGQDNTNSANPVQVQPDTKTSTDNKDNSPDGTPKSMH